MCCDTTRKNDDILNGNYFDFYAQKCFTVRHEHYGVQFPRLLTVAQCTKIITTYNVNVYSFFVGISSITAQCAVCQYNIIILRTGLNYE